MATTGTFEDDERFGLRLVRPYFARAVINTFGDDGSHCTYDITRVPLGVVESSYRCVVLLQLDDEGMIDLRESFSVSASVGHADAAMGLALVDEKFASLEITGFTGTGTFGQDDGFSVSLYATSLGRHILDGSAGGCSVTVTRADPDRIEGDCECAAVIDEGMPPGGARSSKVSAMESQASWGLVRAV